MKNKRAIIANLTSPIKDGGCLFLILSTEEQNLTISTRQVNHHCFQRCLQVGSLSLARIGKNHQSKITLEKHLLSLIRAARTNSRSKSSTTYLMRLSDAVRAIRRSSAGAIVQAKSIKMLKTLQMIQTSTLCTRGIRTSY